MILAAGLRGVAEPSADEVVLKIALHVTKGRLHFGPYVADSNLDQRLEQLYGTKTRAELFKSKVLDQLNADAAEWNPIVEWRIPGSFSNKSTTVGAVLYGDTAPFIGPDDQPLAEWFKQYAARHGNPRLSPKWVVTTKDREKHTVDVAPIPNAVTNLARYLIGHFDVNNLRDVLANQRDTVAITFVRALPITSVTVAGMAFDPAGAAPDTGERSLFGRWSADKRALEYELARSVRAEDLEWQQGIAIKRMAKVLASRGLWNGFDSSDGAAPRNVPWAAFPVSSTGDSIHAEVFLAHVYCLVFIGKARGNDDLKSVSAALLRPAEAAIVARTLTSAPAAGTEAEKIVASDSNGNRYLFIPPVDRIIAGQNAGRAGAGSPPAAVSYDPIPLAEERIARVAKDLQARGYRIAIVAMGTEDFLPEPDDPLLKGGLKVVVSKIEEPPAAEDAGGPAAQPSLRDWHDGLHYLLHRPIDLLAGVGYQSNVPPFATVHAAVTDPDAIGNWIVDLKQDRKFSASLSWVAPTHLAAANELWPSDVRAFSDKPPAQTIGAKTVSLQKDGLAVDKRWDTGLLPDGHQVVQTVAVQASTVSRLGGDPIVTGPEVRASASVGVVRDPNIWDVRETVSYSVNATAATRGAHASLYWVAGAGRFEWRKPIAGVLTFDTQVSTQWIAGQAPLEELPQVGGENGVRGIRPFAVPGRGTVVARNELWLSPWFLERDSSIDQHWYQYYGTLQTLLLLDAGWVSRPTTAPASSFFYSPGTGVAIVVKPITIEFTVAYGIARPSNLGRWRFSFGINRPL